MNSERHGGVEQNREYRLQKEIEEKRRGAFTKAVVGWMGRLEKIEKRNGRLPLNLERGSAFIPAVLFSIMTGCYTHKIVECTQSEEDFLKAVTKFINDHPDQINAKMDDLWPNHSLTGRELANTLTNAVVECGVERISQDPGHFGSARVNQNTIVISVDNDMFHLAMDRYEQGAWTQDMNLDEVIEVYQETQDSQVISDRKAYLLSIYTYAEVLGHEASHLVLGGHSKEVEEYLDQLYATYGEAIPSEYLEELDEMFAWGTASREVGIDQYHEEDEELYSYTQ